MTQGKVLAVVGAQYGSEGKGVIVSHIAKNYDVHVRTGGPNAGHTFMHKGIKCVMQTIPCGWVNPFAVLVIGAGALIDLDSLFNEIKMIEEFDPGIKDRIIIDAAACIISDRHHDEEGGVDGEMHKRIGSTGKGVGTARRDRMMRDPSKITRIGDLDFRSTPVDRHMIKEHTFSWLNNIILEGSDVLLEGTQGTGLDLIHGPWPYVTSNGCTAAQMLADCGIAPKYLTDILLVARTYPIRVAGNSGPMYGEMSWKDISAKMGRPVEERTTVTKKVRRIAEWDPQLLLKAIALNGADGVALTFLDYLSPEDEGCEDFNELSSKSKDFINYVEQTFGVEVKMVGTGGDGWKIIDLQS